MSLLLGVQSLQNDFRMNSNEYTVKDKQQGTPYHVHVEGNTFSCSCDDKTVINICKHSMLVYSVIKKFTINHIIEPQSVNCCPKCKCKKYIKNGKRKKKLGPAQRYLCKSCGHRFTDNLGFEGMRMTPEIITDAIQSFFTHKSLRNIAEGFEQKGISISHTAIWKWVQKYIPRTVKYLSKFVPNLSEKWHGDETYIKVLGKGHYLFTVMDHDTRFCIAHQMKQQKYGNAPTRLFRKAKQAAKTVPKIFVSDSSRSFAKAFRKEFLEKNPTNKRVKHIKETHLRNQRSNNNIEERFNGWLQDNFKVYRGMKKSDSTIISGLIITRNFITRHMGLDGEIPCTMAGIVILGDNRWKTLIQNSSLKK